MRKNKFDIPVTVYFVVTALLIAYFFPREGKFRYQFHEGKPWRYGLLTAPGDFPIYKTEAEVQSERDSVLRLFEPYYKLHTEAAQNEVEKLRANYSRKLQGKVSSAYMRYVEKTLNELYANGIIATQDLEQLRKEDRTRINVRENTMAHRRYVSDLFTVRTAYEFIINNCPPSLDRAKLQSCDLNDYLIENVTYDAETSDKVRNTMLQSLSLANGMVQAGERIVDRGEIIDNHTYNVLRSLKIVHESKSGGARTQGIILAGQFVLVFTLMFCLWIFLLLFRPKIFYNQRNNVFMIFCVLVSTSLTELCVGLGVFNVYIIPYAIVPIVVRTFFDSRTSLFIHVIIAMICSLMVPFPYEFLLLQLVAGMAVTFSLRELSERSQLIRCSFFIFLAYVVTYLSLTLFQEASLQKINWLMMLYFGINFILLMFTYVLVYMLEKTFGYVSSITLVELSNINRPLLKRLSETCPGTFQHSLQVSILAAEAAAKINADAQLVRTGALYHDIGKMCNPVFFTENQTSVNPHNQLSFDQSAQIIISHVTEGVKMAEKEGLPKAVINFIRTHHGCGKTKYFYNSYLNKYPDQPIDESLFTYPGPNPFTKETAILMMADATEAASRSLKEHTEESIENLVNRIIDGQIADGLMRNAPLTFKDVEDIKAVFVEKLKTMYHTRISYPDLKKKG